MKRIISALILVLALFCTACSSRKNEAEVSASETSFSQQEATTQQVQITYLPEEIEQLDWIDMTYKTTGETKRSIYAGLFPEVYRLFRDDNEFNRWYFDWEDTYHRTGKLVSEMFSVVLIKKYNITKEVFEELIRKEAEDRIRHGADLSTEDYELPNADILYTFDNEIIDAYYRRENPVEPDWEQVKVYESYSAYLEENPE